MLISRLFLSDNSNEMKGRERERMQERMKWVEARVRKSILSSHPLYLQSFLLLLEWMPTTTPASSLLLRGTKNFLIKFLLFPLEFLASTVSRSGGRRGGGGGGGKENETRRIVVENLLPCTEPLNRGRDLQQEGRWSWSHMEVSGREWERKMLRSRHLRKDNFSSRRR